MKTSFNRIKPMVYLIRNRAYEVQAHKDEETVWARFKNGVVAEFKKNSIRKSWVHYPRSPLTH